MISKTLPYKKACYDCGKKVSLSLLTWAEQKDPIGERKARCSPCWSNYVKTRPEEPISKGYLDENDLEGIFEIMNVNSIEELFA
jgi:hypothetical protein